MDGLDNVLSTLGVAFDAAVAREEELAAADLAVSLLQDRDLRDVLLRDGPWALLLPDGRRVPLEIVGADFVGGDSVLVPLSRAVVSKSVQRATAARDAGATLQQVVRNCTRARTTLRLGDGVREWSGRVTICGRDYVALACPTGEVILPLASVAWFRLDGSDDVVG